MEAIRCAWCERVAIVRCAACRRYVCREHCQIVRLPVDEAGARRGVRVSCTRCLGRSNNTAAE